MSGPGWGKGQEEEHGSAQDPSPGLKPQSPADQLAFKVKTDSGCSPRGESSEAEGALACWEGHSSIVSGFGVRWVWFFAKKKNTYDFPGSPVVETLCS